MASDARRQIEQLVRKAEDQGWAVRRTRNNHFRLTPPAGGRGYTVPSTPNGGNRAAENSIAALKRAGLVIDN